MSPGSIATVAIPSAIASRAIAAAARTTAARSTPANPAVTSMAATTMSQGTAQTVAKFVAQPLRQVRALGCRLLLRDSQERHRQESRHDKFLHGPNPFLSWSVAAFARMRVGWLLAPAFLGMRLRTTDNIALFPQAVLPIRSYPTRRNGISHVAVVAWRLSRAASSIQAEQAFGLVPTARKLLQVQA